MLSRAASVRTRVARATRALPCAALAISSRRSTASSARAEPMPNSPTVVLSWGSDSMSALGNGNLDLFRSTPYPIAFPPNAYAPAPHSAAADSAGGAPASARASPVLPGEEIVDVATSWTSTLAVTSSGAVYQWGSLWTLRDAISAAMFRARTPRFYRFLQRFTSLGRLVNVGLAPRPRQLPIFGAQTPQDFDKKVGGSQVSLTSDSVFDPASVRATRVAVGAEASAAVTEAGFLYTWSTSGDTVGTLGRKLSSLPADPVDMSVPALLARVTGASQLSARSLTAPAPVPALLGHKVVDVAMGFHHLLALTDTGEVFACGKAETGALGVPLAFVSRKEARFVEEPVSVTEAVKAFMGDLKDAAQLEQVKQEQALARRRADAAAAAAASPSSSSAAAAAAAAAANASSAFAAKGAADPVTTVGALGELGRITAIAAGFSHSAFLDDRGRLWTCGKNTHGELGLLVALGGDAVERLDFRLNYVPTRVRALDGHKVVKVSCGAHHTAVLTSAGEVLTWGSNKYGQCGRPHEAPVAGSGGQRTGQQAWSLPPGAVRVAAVGGKDPDTGRVVRIVDIACGPYDTALTLSNGRVVMCGTYLEEKGTHRPPFAVAEFDSTATAAAAPAPAPVAAGAVDHGAGRSLVSLASADAVAPHVAKLDSTPSTGAGAAGVRDRFFATKVVLGLGHAYAFAKKRE